MISTEYDVLRLICCLYTATVHDVKTCAGARRSRGARVSPERTDVPTGHIWVAGIQCGARSSLNKNRKRNSGRNLEESSTGKDALTLCDLYDSPISEGMAVQILENVEDFDDSNPESTSIASVLRNQLAGRAFRSWSSVQRAMHYDGPSRRDRHYEGPMRLTEGTGPLVLKQC